MADVSTPLGASPARDFVAYMESLNEMQAQSEAAKVSGWVGGALVSSRLPVRVCLTWVFFFFPFKSLPFSLPILFSLS